MEPLFPLSDVTHVIQLAVAPVFLLTAVGTILGVLANRLARIVDRARVLTDRLDVPELDANLREQLAAEMKILLRRRKLVNFAFTFGITTALLVCILIASAFLAALLSLNAGVAIAILFVAAMASFVAALLLFLREILLAASSIRRQAL